MAWYAFNRLLAMCCTTAPKSRLVRASASAVTFWHDLHLPRLLSFTLLHLRLSRYAGTSMSLRDVAASLAIVTRMPFLAFWRRSCFFAADFRASMHSLSDSVKHASAVTAASMVQTEGGTLVCALARCEAARTFSGTALSAVVRALLRSCAASSLLIKLIIMLIQQRETTGRSVALQHENCFTQTRTSAWRTCLTSTLYWLLLA